MPTINKLDLINAIKVGLVNYLGTYTFPPPDNSSQLAIASLPDSNFGFNYPPGHVTVTGIECAINAPRVNASPRIYNHSWVSARFEIFLKQWSADAPIESALDTLLCVLSANNYRWGNVVDLGANESLGLLRTISVDVIDNYWLLPT